MTQPTERLPELPSWRDDQDQRELDRAYERALKVFKSREREFKDLPEGTIVLVDANGDVTVGSREEGLVSISERHYREHRSSFDSLFEFRIERN